jgi:hypothetical protein
MVLYVPLASVARGVFLSFVLVLGATSIPRSETMPDESYVPNELIVTFSKQVPASEIKEINERLSEGLGFEVGPCAFDRHCRVRVSNADSLEKIKAAYEATPGVEHVERTPRAYVQPQTEVDSGGAGVEDKAGC